MKSYINDKMIQVMPSVPSWQEAIRKGARPLREEGYITEEYVEAMIETVIELGPYILLAPFIAMPHARPERGSLKKGLSILKLEEPISLTDDDKNMASVFIVLSSAGNEGHLEMLASLSERLSDESFRNQLTTMNDKESILTLFNSYQ